MTKESNNMINNIKSRGGYGTNLHDSKLVFVASPYDGDEKQIETVENVIRELIKDDKKNRKYDMVYISPLKAFNWLDNTIDKEEMLDYSLKLLTLANEIYVLPEYAFSESVNQCIGMAKLLGIPITYL